MQAESCSYCICEVIRCTVRSDLMTYFIICEIVLENFNSFRDLQSNTDKHL